MRGLTVGVEENIQEVVGHITEGVCRPLKVRCLSFLCVCGIGINYCLIMSLNTLITACIKAVILSN